MSRQRYSVHHKSLQALFREVYGDPAAPDLASAYDAAQQEFEHAPCGSALYLAYLRIAEAEPRLPTWLASYGVDFEHCNLVAGPITAPDIHTHGRRFTIVPPGEGDSALVLPVFDTEGQPADLVAFQPRHPGLWWLALGEGAALGAAAVVNPASYVHGPLAVHVDPLAWLKSRCEGVVMLDAARGRAVLRRAIGAIAAQDLMHAKRLAQALAPDIPRNRIMVPKVAA